ncbi:MAG: hypothetical protein QM750_31860 [Rubrivivax sp.]
MNPFSFIRLRRWLWLSALPAAAALLLPPPAVAAASPASAASEAEAKAEYKPVELASWVPPLRSPTRIILRPTGVSFNAELAALPRPQKSDYLQLALRTMQVNQAPQVSRAVLLKYGSGADQQLVAYVDDGTAERISKDLRVGDRREFFAFHVYNYSRGPALVITSFGPAR